MECNRGSCKLPTPVKLDSSFRRRIRKCIRRPSDRALMTICSSQQHSTSDTESSCHLCVTDCHAQLHHLLNGGTCTVHVTVNQANSVSIRSRRRTSTFGLPSDSESDFEGPPTDSDSELSSPSSLSSDSFCYESESQVPPPPPCVYYLHYHICVHTHLPYFFSRPKREPRSPAEQRHAEDTVAAIRLRTRYHDPYEEWEKQTRKDAFVRSYQFLLRSLPFDNLSNSTRRAEHKFRRV
jgi:hypothetical protein